MISAIGQILSTIIALVAAVYVARQINLATKVSDRDSLLKFVSEIYIHERAFKYAEDGEDRDFEFICLLNFLEANAAIYNAGQFHKLSKKIIRSKLIGSLKLISESEYGILKMNEAITDSTTFNEIILFYKGSGAKFFIHSNKLENDRLKQ